MQWLLWTAMLARSQMSSSLRNGPRYMGLPQPMPSVLQVNMPVRRVYILPLDGLWNFKSLQKNVTDFFCVWKNSRFMSGVTTVCILPSSGERFTVMVCTFGVLRVRLINHSVYWETISAVFWLFLFIYYLCKRKKSECRWGTRGIMGSLMDL